MAKIDIEKLEQNFDQFRVYRQKVNNSIAEIKREMIDKGMNDFSIGIEKFIKFCETWSSLGDWELTDPINYGSL